MRQKVKSKAPLHTENAQFKLYDHRAQVGPENYILPKPEFFVRRTQPKPSPVFRTYWQFAKKRQDIFYSRIFNSEHASAVVDPILARYRFTNTYRASDRVSQFLIRHILYDREWTPKDILFRLLLFKFFNKIETWKALTEVAGEISWKTYDFAAFDGCLSDLMRKGQKIYSAAYIMPSGLTAYGHKRKHRNHLKIISKIISDGTAARLLEQPSLKKVFELLRSYPCIGPFVGYQLAIDLNYSPMLNFSENDFVEAGPGALDGIAKCFFNLGDYKPADIIRYMVDAQEEAFGRFAPGFGSLWGRPLHLIDCQNVFCEVSKYARVAHPDIPGETTRSRIKQNYRPALLPLELPWFPPKWGLNEKIAADNRLAR